MFWRIFWARKCENSNCIKCNSNDQFVVLVRTTFHLFQIFFNNKMLLWVFTFWTLFACSNYDQYRECTISAVRHHCGQEAADLAQQLIVISGGNEVSQKCVDYTTSMTVCSKLISNATGSASKFKSLLSIKRPTFNSFSSSQSTSSMPFFYFFSLLLTFIYFFTINEMSHFKL